MSDYVVKPHLGPWPLSGESDPLTPEELNILDQRFIRWLGDFIDDSLVYIEQELTRLGIEASMAQETKIKISKAVLSEWVRIVIDRDSMVKLLAEGKKRDQTLLEAMFRAKFGLALSQPKRTPPA